MFDLGEGFEGIREVGFFNVLHDDIGVFFGDANVGSAEEFAIAFFLSGHAIRCNEDDILGNAFTHECSAWFTEDDVDVLHVFFEIEEFHKDEFFVMKFSLEFLE